MPQTIYNTPPFSNTMFAGEVGIELEYDGDNLPRATPIVKGGPAWVAKEDGSLRGSAGGDQRGGIEYVLSEPCSREQVRPMLTQLFDFMDKSQAEFIISNRTSSHVHVNVSQMKINEVTSMIILWAIFEEALANWCGENRVGNHFCLRGKDCSVAVDAYYQGLTDSQFRFNIPEGAKYMACNYRALQAYGSLEFRTFGGCDDINRLDLWIKFLLALKDYSRTVMNNPEIIPQTFSERGAEQVLRDICELGRIPQFANQVLEMSENHDMRGMTYSALRNFQKLCYCLDWTKLLPEFYKDFIPSPFKMKMKPETTGMRLEALSRAASVRPRAARISDDVIIDFDED